MNKRQKKKKLKRQWSYSLRTGRWPGYDQLGAQLWPKEHGFTMIIPEGEPKFVRITASYPGSDGVGPDVTVEESK